MGAIHTFPLAVTVLALALVSCTEDSPTGSNADGGSGGAGGEPAFGGGPSTNPLGGNQAEAGGGAAPTAEGGAGGGLASCLDSCSAEHSTGVNAYVAIANCILCEGCFNSCAGAFVAGCDAPAETSACDALACGDPSNPGEPEQECTACALDGLCKDEREACSASAECLALEACVKGC